MKSKKRSTELQRDFHRFQIAWIAIEAKKMIGKISKVTVENCYERPSEFKLAAGIGPWKDTS